MSLRTHERRSIRRPPAFRRLAALVFAAILAAACSGPAPHQPRELFDRGPALENETPTLGSSMGRQESSEDRSQPAAGDERSPGPALDTEELVGLGEFGLLPSLLEALSPGSDCDPDDPMSPCQ